MNLSALTPYAIAVCHQKGGVAKTTTVSAIGACLAEMGHRVLLIDLDHSANLSVGVGISLVSVKKSSADILLGNETIGSLIQSTMITGLDIIPANLEMITAARFLILRPQYEYLLRNYLLFSELDGYDYILMDCPPGLGPVTMAALSAAHLALIPLPCEFYALQALDSVFMAIKAIRAKTNSGLRFRLLVTMFDRRGKLHPRVFSLIQEQFENALLNTTIGFDSKLRESQMLGKPITLHAPNSRSALQYRALAEEILAYVESQKVLQPAE